MGSAIHFQAQSTTEEGTGPLQNCVIYYYPRNDPTTTTSSYVDRWSSCLQSFNLANRDKLTGQPRLYSSGAEGFIDLTKLADDLTRALLKHFDETQRVRGNEILFKAVVIVPGYGRKGSPQHGAYRGPWQGTFAGLAAKHGHVVFDHFHVPVGSKRKLGSDPVGIKLHIFVSLGSDLELDGRALPDCKICGMCAKQPG